jgi:hypothetical protein
VARFSDKPAAATLTGSEIVPATQSGGDVQTTSQAIANLYKGTRGTAISSASSIDLGAATGSNLHITGTATITSLGTVAAGTERTVIFDGALTLTHNATSLILPGGASITTAANDSATFISEGSGNWRCARYQKASGQSVAGSAVSSVNGLTGAVTIGGEIIAEPVSALTNSGGTVAINCALGDYFTLSLTANVTSITFSNLPASGKGQTLMLEIKQDATGSRTATWPSSFKWASGSAGVLSTAANSVDVLALSTFDQGTTWRATLAKGFA